MKESERKRGGRCVSEGEEGIGKGGGGGKTGGWPERLVSTGSRYSPQSSHWPSSPLQEHIAGFG